VIPVPIYEYQCTKCGEVFEAFQKMNDEPVSRCRFCDGSVERLISHTSFQLKGSGWYLTDYSRKSQPSDGGSSGVKESKSSENKTSEGAGAGTPATPSTPSKTSENKT
jgi:putative FmdB family regulatory protein